MRTLCSILMMVCIVAVALPAQPPPASQKTNDVTTGEVRDPLAKPLKLVIGGTNALGAPTTQQTKRNRREDIQRVLATCRIEGIALCGGQRLVVVNDRLLAEGDRLTPDVDIRIKQIEQDKVVLTLDNETLTYSLTPPPEKPTP